MKQQNATQKMAPIQKAGVWTSLFILGWGCLGLAVLMLATMVKLTWMWCKWLWPIW